MARGIVPPTANRTKDMSDRNRDSGLPVTELSERRAPASVVKMNIYKSNCLAYYR